MGGQSDLRASDADRERVAERLRQALTEGRLSHDEFEERLRAALSARTYGELDPLLADLPDEPHQSRSAAGVATAAPGLFVPAPPYVPATPRTNGMAIASLVLGCAGFFFLWGVGPLLALVFGILGKNSIERSNGLQTGRGIAVAGIILGILGLLVTAAFIALIVVAAVVGAGSSVSSPPG